MSSSTVMITGGTDFIGSYVTSDLVVTGHDVVAYDRPTNPRILDRFGVADDVTIRRGNATGPADVFRVVREVGATRIVHLVTLLTATAREDLRAALDISIQGTNNVFETAYALPGQVEHVVWAPSAAVCASPTDHGGDLVTESGLVYLDALCGATKRYGEHQTRVCYGDLGVPHVALRPTVTYGPYRETGGFVLLTNIAEKPTLGEPFSVDYGDRVIDWQHVRDIAQAFRKATFVPEDGLSQRVYNVRGELATIREAAETVRWLLPDADLTISGEGELPWAQELDVTQVQADLDYDPEYDLETGFHDYVDMLRKEHGLEPV